MRVKFMLCITTVSQKKQYKIHNKTFKMGWQDGSVGKEATHYRY